MEALLALALGFFRTTLLALPTPVLLRGPYLQRPDDRTIAILWTTDSPGLGTVRYGTPGSPSRTVSEGAAVAAHEIRLSDLKSGRMYQYQVLVDGAPLSPVYAFRAPRDTDDDDVFFAVIGDTADRTVPAHIAAHLRDTAPDLVLHVGDVVYPDGRLESYDSEFFGPLGPLLAAAPILPILGDHDIRTQDGAPFFSVFEMPGNGITPQPRYYSFRQGEAEFFCLDVESSEYGDDSDQYRWLVRHLAASSAMWKFVTVFEPPFSSENSNTVEQLILSPLFEQYGVDIVFSGHEHLYERTKPIRMFGASGTPVTYIVEGGGGASLSRYDRTDFSAFLAAEHGYVTVAIHGGDLRLEAHDTDGALLDTMTLQKAANCCGEDVPPPLVPVAPPSAADVSSGRH